MRAQCIDLRSMPQANLWQPSRLGYLIGCGLLQDAENAQCYRALRSFSG